MSGNELPPLSGWHARLRMLVAIAIGVVAGCLVPEMRDLLSRVLFGWDVAVWSFLLLILQSMFRHDPRHVRRYALAQADSAAIVLAVAVVAAGVAVVGIVYELAQAKVGGHHGWPHVVFAFATVGGAWLLVPTMFALNYASLYHRDDGGSDLHFPDEDDDPGFEPDYLDFLYFSFTIAVASQTADVAITDRPTRRLTLMHAILSFGFNTVVLALTINIAASLM